MKRSLEELESECARVHAIMAERDNLRMLLSDLHRVTRPLLEAGTLGKYQDDCWAEYLHTVKPAVEKAIG